MSNQTSTSSPTKSPGTNVPALGKPGAGLPPFELAIAKLLIFPYRFKTVSNENAIADFESETAQILALVQSLSTDQFCEKKLIKRVRGLEDNSRFWSCAMAVEHLIIAGTSMRGVILSLSKGQGNMPESAIADMKPNPQIDPSGLIERFEQMSQKFVKTANSAKIDAFPHIKYAHPWFGPLNAHEWLCFSAPHQRIHRQQIEQIVEQLS